MGLIDLFCRSFAHAPDRIVLDIDDTEDAVHGAHQHCGIPSCGVRLFGKADEAFFCAARPFFRCHSVHGYAN